MFVEWTDDLSIGVSEIDAHHQTLIGIINDLHQAVKNESGAEALGVCLGQLADYIGYHFSFEEQVMRNVGYPNLEEHLSLHRGLTDDLTQIIFEFDLNGTIEIEKTLEFLRNWVVQHIREEDGEIGRFLSRVRCTDGL